MKQMFVFLIALFFSGACFSANAEGLPTLYSRCTSSIEVVAPRNDVAYFMLPSMKEMEEELKMHRVNAGDYSYLQIKSVSACDFDPNKYRGDHALLVVTEKDGSEKKYGVSREGVAHIFSLVFMFKGYGRP